MKNNINPFIGYGRPVFGNRLVGRETELKKLGENIISSTASISIVGQRRIGKTSLITETKRKFQKQLPPYLLLISLDFSAFDDGVKFFSALIEELQENLPESHCTVPNKFKRVLERESNTAYECYRKFRRALVVLKQGNISTKLILDEFDSIRKINEADQVIQWIRELVDKGFETGLSIIFISRRSLFLIEKQIVHVSNLDHVCEKLYVRPLENKALNRLIDRARTHLSISEKDHEQIIEYTGGHPFLAELILCHSYERKSIEKGIEASISELFNFYEHLRYLLEEDSLFDQLIQLVIGPSWNLRLNSASTLLNYGLVITPDNKKHLAWSIHFQEYLEKISRDFPIWELWSNTESLMRDFIENVFTESYGEDWLSRLKERKNHIPEIINKCEVLMNRECKQFGLNANQRWLDYTYPNELWQIISLEWDKFSPLIQQKDQRKNKKYWDERFGLLAKIRNPLAHNRTKVISEFEFTLANAYCNELCEIISTAPKPTCQQQL